MPKKSSPKTEVAKDETKSELKTEASTAKAKATPKVETFKNVSKGVVVLSWFEGKAQRYHKVPKQGKVSIAMTEEAKAALAPLLRQTVIQRIKA